jgi:hypothetical protein
VRQGWIGGLLDEGPGLVEVAGGGCGGWLLAGELDQVALGQDPADQLPAGADRSAGLLRRGQQLLGSRGRSAESEAPEQVAPKDVGEADIEFLGAGAPGRQLALEALELGQRLEMRGARV